MRGMANVAIVILASSPMLQACQMFGGGGDAATPRYASQRNADCARLAPLVTKDDGGLTREDMEAGLKLEFKKWDKDGNNELSMAEIGPLNDGLRAQNVGASPVMDWNGDGHVNYQEFASGWRTMFDLCAHGLGNTVTKADMSRSPNVAPPRTEPVEKPPAGSTTKPGNDGRIGH